jgi:hypothetical protein
MSHEYARLFGEKHEWTRIIPKDFPPSVVLLHEDENIMQRLMKITIGGGRMAPAGSRKTMGGKIIDEHRERRRLPGNGF